jgi:TonB family protein
MRRMLAVVAWVMLFVSAVGMGAQEAAPASGADEWGTLVAANNLDVKGNSPFHLVMTFQLYDLDGKATGTGTFEEWWAAQGSQKIIVHLPGLNEDGKAPEGADTKVARDAYLVGQLMNAAVRPVPPESRADASATTKTESFGKNRLDCTARKVILVGATDAQPTTVCVKPQTTDVLIVEGLGRKETLMRPSTGKFHDTYVALEVQIGFIGRNAITGKVTTMQSFDPAKSEVKLSTVAPPAASQPNAVRIVGGVIAGHLVKSVDPEYPALATMQHVSGSVLLNAVIGKDGSVERLVPIASTDSSFTDAAIQSVKKWKYSPYLLNGEPTEVDTTITVNFAMNRMN